MQPFVLRLIILAALAAAPAAAHSEDLVEFLTGAKAHGHVSEIRKADKEFDFVLNLAGQSLTRTYAFSQVHAVTMNGKRFVLTENTSGTGSKAPATLSRQQVLALINTLGSTPPDWYEQTPLEHPESLDLSWPKKPPTKGWKNQVNIGQYLWDIIYPNPNKWRSGIRLLHHELTIHKDQPELLDRDMQVLGQAYFNLLQDYPRAAFWLSQAEPLPGRARIALAECYWRLGNKAMALEKVGRQALPVQAIKLLGDMGYTDRATRLAELFAKRGDPHVPYLLAGDASRLAGQLDQAVGFYQKVLDAEQARNADYTQRYRSRAQESIDAIRLFDQADLDRVADGSYRAASTGYNGPVEVEATVADGKLTSLEVVDHREKQFYAALTDTPNQILDRQSVREIDGTSGATITSQAIVNATARALATGSN